MIGTQFPEKSRSLRVEVYVALLTAGLAMLIFEAILVGCVEGTTESKDDDPLATAAALYKIDAKARRSVVTKEAREKARKKAEKTTAKAKSGLTSKHNQK